MSINYKDAGVDVERGYEAVRLIKEHAQKTFDGNVITDLGSFGGMYDIGGGQVLVSGTDGVGTKLKAAFALNKHDTVGIDCVAMCVNDVVCLGARPLFFLDYIATGKLVPQTTAEIVKGISDGCIMSGCALVGGETAEMPGFYEDGEYDMAGFCVGMVARDDVINGSGITAGDTLIGIASSGIHSNGFSLVRRLFAMDDTLRTETYEGISLGEMFLTPTKIYVKPVLKLISDVAVKGLAHITGGGFIENIPRMLPEGIGAKIQLKSWDMPPVFRLLVGRAGLSDDEAYNTFNMGIGMVAAVPKEQASAALSSLKASGESAFIIGEAISGEGVTLCK